MTRRVEWRVSLYAKLDVKYQNRCSLGFSLNFTFSPIKMQISFRNKNPFQDLFKIMQGTYNQKIFASKLIFSSFIGARVGV